MHTDTHSSNSTPPAPRFHVAQNVARTMSSREIAELTGKRHPDVKRDIAAMLKALNGDVSSFARIYLDGLNREQTEYQLDREHTDCLLTGYSVPMRMKVALLLRRKRRWRAVEAP